MNAISFLRLAGAMFPVRMQCCDMARMDLTVARDIVSLNLSKCLIGMTPYSFLRTNRALKHLQCVAIILNSDFNH